MSKEAFSVDDISDISRVHKIADDIAPSIIKVTDVLGEIKDAVQEMAGAAKLELKNDVWKFEFGPLDVRVGTDVTVDPLAYLAKKGAGGKGCHPLVPTRAVRRHGRGHRQFRQY